MATQENYAEHLIALHNKGKASDKHAYKLSDIPYDSLKRLKNKLAKELFGAKPTDEETKKKTGCLEEKGGPRLEETGRAGRRWTCSATRYCRFVRRASVEEKQHLLTPEKEELEKIEEEIEKAHAVSIACGLAYKEGFSGGVFTILTLQLSLLLSTFGALALWRLISRI
jgi:hypothetical protein